MHTFLVFLYALECSASLAASQPAAAEPRSADSASPHRVFVSVLAMMNVPNQSPVRAAAARTAAAPNHPTT